MAEKIRSMRLNVSVGAVLVLLIGIVFLVWPGETIRAITQTVGFVLALIGLSQFLGKLFSSVNKSSGMLVGALIAVIGFWIVIHPEQAASIIPIIFGMILVVHGIQNVSLAFVGRGYKMPRWGWLLLGGLINIAFGAVCIVCAFATVRIVFRLLGAMLVYDGISSMLTVHRINRYERDYVDVEYREL